MTPDPIASELLPNSLNNQEHASEITPRSPVQEIIPSGLCMFIISHKSAADQRCNCPGFARNAALPGAYCSCGHQASYHSHQDDDGHMPPPPVAANTIPTSIDPLCTSPSHATLVHRIQHLESEHANDRKQWEKELRRERHSRQEDIRTLREAMHAFFRVIEKDIPRQFADVEDRIESLVDHHQRVREKIVSVDDFSMALDDRVMELEKVVSPSRFDDGGGEGERARQGDGDGLVMNDFRVPLSISNSHIRQNGGHVLNIKEEAPENDSTLRHKKRASHSSNPYNPMPGLSTGEPHHVPNQLQTLPKEPAAMKRKRSIQVERKSESGIRLTLPNPPPLLLSD
ncbi:hypothetical protein BGW36DRAFT_385372 [Talaromyces proteolyticus]|uniref:Uncharacterized protein n=1 Tax=Talaromyces proteolyticus TaxID=1131652 RepID=A0AAD4PX89_9EURO|nr:uncharacterized protein BGW36DRAFT_385372 [Talaromyces proteolyticus]KAH8692866.1 hypothetical protein BGW36DRAFT_385372 [Talaromyces proteolyticus]